MAEDGGRLGLVDHQPVQVLACGGNQLGRILRRGGEVQDCGAGRLRQGLLDRGGGDLGAEDQDAAVVRGGFGYVGGADLVVGAGGDDDEVLAGLVDRDHGQPGGDTRHGSYRLSVDPFGAQGGQQLAAEVVAADAADHAYVGAQPSSGDGLVGALATRGELG